MPDAGDIIAGRLRIIAELGEGGTGGDVQERTLSCEIDDGATEPLAVRCATDAQPPRVVRGGAWSSTEENAVEATATVRLNAATQTADQGSRCVSRPR